MTEKLLINKKKNKLNITDIVGDCLCCLLASGVLSLVALDRLGQDAGLWSAIFLSLINIGIILIITRKWWILPAAIAAAAVLTLSICLIFGLTDDLINYVKGFYDWVIAAFPLQLPYSENGSILLVRLAIVFPITALMYLYFRRLFVLVLQPVGFGALLVWLYYSDSEYFLTVLALALVVMTASLAKHTGRILRKRYPGDKRLPEGMLQLPALALAFIILLFSFAFSPKADGDWQSRWLNELVNDLSDYWDFRMYGRNGMGSFDIGRSGYAPYGDKLGGDINPDNNVVMRITTDTPSLLLGSVYDTYNGYSWFDTSQLGRFRLHSAFWQNRRREVFALDRPLGGKAAAVLYEAMTKTSKYRITPAFRSFTLFNSGKPLTVTTLTGDKIDAYFNLQTELFYEEGWRAYNTYTITSVIFDRSDAGFDKNMLELEKISYEKEDEYFESIKEIYLQLPDTLPENVSALALDITNGSASPYEAALSIENWISENSTYTLTPGDVPEGRDFVDYFLETGEGYCTYYASAMTILARCAGLPARYCTGYAMSKVDDKTQTSFMATNRTAHAWTEIYFSGIGWIVFDPAKWNFYEIVNVDSPDDTVSPVQTPSLPVNESTIGDIPEEVVISPPVINAVNSGQSFWLTLVNVLSVIIGAIILILIVRLIMMNTGADSVYRRLSRKYPDRGDRLDAAYSKLIKQLSFIGLKMENRDTISSFTKSVDDYMGNNKMSLISEPVIRHRFGSSEVTDADVRALCESYMENEKRLRSEMGLPRYLFRRVLLGK